MAEQYRKFWIINGLNKRYDFTLKEQNVFLESPSGLGFSKTLETIAIGNSAVKKSETYTLPTVTGNLMFIDSVAEAYYAYKEFINFISYGNLTLHYQTPDTLSSYYMDCEVTKLDKSEYESKYPYMECPITFTGLSLWKNDKEVEMTVKNGQETDGKHYPLTRNYFYPGSTFGSMQLNVNSDVEVGFQLEITGKTVNPIIIAHQNNKMYGKIKLDGTFDYIKINSDDANEDIYLENNGVPLTNPYMYQDLSIADGTTDITFFKLPVGQSILSFSCENMSDFTGSVKFKWKDEKVSV